MININRICPYCGALYSNQKVLEKDTTEYNGPSGKEDFHINMYRHMLFGNKKMGLPYPAWKSNGNMNMLSPSCEHLLGHISLLWYKYVTTKKCIINL